MAVEVVNVRTERERRAFIDLPYRLHATSPQWVPPLRLERRLFLSPRMNPFFRHGEAQLFLARRDGRVAGRLSAHVDRLLNETQGEPWGLFGFLELEDDQEVADALFAAAEAWLRERGCDRMVGPMEFTMNDGAGILVEGFERRPMVRQTWHPPYVAARCEGAGLGKAMDLFMWELYIQDRESVLPVIFELADQAEAEHGVRIRKMRRLRLRRELDLFAEIYNRAWRRNWGFRPYTKEDLDHYAQELQLVYDRNWFMVAERDGEAVGMAITVPDVNQALAHMNGRLLPLGWWHFLRRRTYMTTVRVGFLGVKPEHQHTGVAALLYREHFDMAATTPQKGGEMGWILESNEAMNRGMEAMGGRIVKRYRMFERRFDGVGAGD